MAWSITTTAAERSSHELDPRTGNSVEIFYADAGLTKSLGGRTGWFWWTCRVGSLPSCSPMGPFAISYLAYGDAARQSMLEA